MMNSVGLQSDSVGSAWSLFFPSSSHVRAEREARARAVHTRLTRVAPLSLFFCRALFVRAHTQRVSLKLQKRLAASVLKCGERKVWLDPNEAATIGQSNSRKNVRKLIKDGLIIKKPVAMHSRARTRLHLASKRKVRTSFSFFCFRFFPLEVSRTSRLPMATFLSLVM
jgi:hypothetical protein